MNSSFKWKELFIPVSPPDFPLSYSCAYFSILCAHWTDSVKSEASKKEAFFHSYILLAALGVQAWALGLDSFILQMGRHEFGRLCLGTGPWGCWSAQQQSRIISNVFPSLACWVLSNSSESFQAGFPYWPLWKASQWLGDYWSWTPVLACSMIQLSKSGTASRHDFMNKWELGPAPYCSRKKKKDTKGFTLAMYFPIPNPLTHVLTLHSCLWSLEMECQRNLRSTKHPPWYRGGEPPLSAKGQLDLYNIIWRPYKLINLNICLL